MTTIKDTLRENILALLRRDAGGELPPRQSGVSALNAKAGKTAASWGQRFLDGTDIGLSRLEEVAKLWGLKPWQLLVPDIDPAHPPTLTEDASTWPLPMVDKDAYLSLGPQDRAWCQSKMDTAIQERLDRLGKQSNR